MVNTSKVMWFVSGMAVPTHTDRHIQCESAWIMGHMSVYLGKLNVKTTHKEAMISVL